MKQTTLEHQTILLKMEALFSAMFSGPLLFFKRKVIPRYNMVLFSLNHSVNLTMKKIITLHIRTYLKTKFVYLIQQQI